MYQIAKDKKSFLLSFFPSNFAILRINGLVISKADLSSVLFQVTNNFLKIISNRYSCFKLFVTTATKEQNTDIFKFNIKEISKKETCL